MRAALFAAAKKRLTLSADNVHVIMDGDSITYGYRAPGPGLTIARQLVETQGNALYGSGLTVVNSGVSGQSWSDMTATLPTLVAGKLNVVIAWGFTNALTNLGQTAAQALAGAAAYAAALRSANQGRQIRLVTMTTLAREGGYALGASTILGLNQKIDDANSQLRTSYQQLGYDALIDLRVQGGPFDMEGDYSTAGFDAVNTRAGAQVWLESSTPSRIHMTDFGDSLIAKMMSDQAAVW